MAPKKQPKADAAPPPVDPTVEIKSLQSVTELLAKAKHLRNYFQLERDKVKKFWDISRKELENVRHELLNADHELEEAEHKHQVEMKVYRQKVRHLLYEHKIQAQEIAEQSDAGINAATVEHLRNMEELKAEKLRLHSEISALVSDHEEKVLQEQETHRLKVHDMAREHREKNLTEARRRYEAKISQLKTELELRRRAEIHEIEERKNEHINELIKQHERKFAEMKTYYNKITSNNLDLIQSLKEEIASMEVNEKHNGTLMYDIERENHEMTEPLQIARRDVARLQHELHNYEKDKLSLRNTRSRLKMLDGEYRSLQEDHFTLKKKYQDVSEDRESIKKKFEMALHDAMDEVNEKNTSVEQRLMEIHAKVDERDAQLQNVLTAVNLEPSAVELVTRQLEDTLEAKNRAIKDLHFELKKIERQHKDVLSEYERRCVVAKLPTLDLTEIV